MNFEEFQKKFNSILEKPDELDAAKDLVGEMESVFEKADADAVKIVEQEKKIRDLQDTNMKLFLAQTAEPEEEPEDEKEKTFEELLKEAAKEEEDA